jgi:hypothetical protein
MHMTIIATMKKHRKEAEVAIVEMKKAVGEVVIDGKIGKIGQSCWMGWQRGRGGHWPTTAGTHC